MSKVRIIELLPAGLCVHSNARGFAYRGPAGDPLRGFCAVIKKEVGMTAEKTKQNKK